MSDDVRWIRSYVLAEPDGTVGTVCIYQASSPEAIRDHAKRAELPADEILPVADTVLVPQTERPPRREQAARLLASVTDAVMATGRVFVRTSSTTR